MAGKRKRPADVAPSPEPPNWDYSERDGVCTWRSFGSQSWLACHVSDHEITFECYRYHPAYDEEPIRDFDRYSPAAFLAGAGQDELRERMGEAVLAPIIAEVRRRNPQASSSLAVLSASLIPDSLRRPLDWSILILLALAALIVWLGSFPARRILTAANDYWNGRPQELAGTIVATTVFPRVSRSTRGTDRKYLEATIDLQLGPESAGPKVMLSVKEFPRSAEAEAESWLRQNFPTGRAIPVWQWTTRPTEYYLDESSARPSLLVLLVDIALTALAVVFLAVIAAEPIGVLAGCLFGTINAPPDH